MHSTGPAINSLDFHVEIEGPTTLLDHPESVVIESSNRSHPGTYMAVINAVHSIHVIFYTLQTTTLIESNSPTARASSFPPSSDSQRDHTVEPVVAVQWTKTLHQNARLRLEVRRSACTSSFAQVMTLLVHASIHVCRRRVYQFNQTQIARPFLLPRTGL